ncbi:hypothetical protein [Sulfurimonas sp. HSL-1716]|uniref:hypothetical protein n=1 Tax=Hydrocurvibacter sulfurireducens TaxID=3131937 RepID=UPI0031F861DF
MYIKRYTIAVSLFVILLGWYVYTFVTQQSIAVDFFGIVLPSLPVAVLVVLPVILLYIASVLHMSFYSLVGTLNLRKYEKDYEKLISSISDALLGKKNRHYEFKTQRYKQLGKVLDNISIYTNAQITEIDDEKLSSTLDIINKIKNGDVVDLKKLGLQSDNELVILNDRNRYNAKDISAEDVLGKSAKYPKELCIKAYTDLSKTASAGSIEKYKEFMSKDSLLNILSRINADKDPLDITNESLIQLFSLLDLQEKDFIEASHILSKNMVPEQRIRLFELLSDKSEEAMGGYLYTLYDLEMLSPADEILDNSQPDEYMYFKAYRALKECNKNYDISLFV